MHEAGAVLALPVLALALFGGYELAMFVTSAGDPPRVDVVRAVSTIHEKGETRHVTVKRVITVARRQVATVTRQQGGATVTRQRTVTVPVTRRSIVVRKAPPETRVVATTVPQTVRVTVATPPSRSEAGRPRPTTVTKTLTVTSTKTVTAPTTVVVTSTVATTVTVPPGHGH
jgi:hypothetical protein